MANLSYGGARDLHFRCESVKTVIEAMSKDKQLTVLGILKKNTLAKLNETRNGIYVNMAFLSEETIRELEAYISSDAAAAVNGGESESVPVE
jgi:hypothetical protein